MNMTSSRRFTHSGFVILGSQRCVMASEPPIEPAKEWAAAVALMVVFALVGLAFIVFMRS